MPELIVKNRKNKRHYVIQVNEKINLNKIEYTLEKSINGDYYLISEDEQQIQIQEYTSDIYNSEETSCILISEDSLLINLDIYKCAEYETISHIPQIIVDQTLRDHQERKNEAKISETITQKLLGKLLK